MYQTKLFPAFLRNPRSYKKNRPAKKQAASLSRKKGASRKSFTTSGMPSSFLFCSFSDVSLYFPTVSW
ncbi:hypothetical protein CLOM621_08897 [Clostridium sp. M62/1]|nr:hypothetical protein CLOM621_08897 [Clostridium sp. M62/1]